MDQNKSKERVMKALNFQKPDRIPIDESFWDEFADNCRKAHNLPKNTDIRKKYGIDISIICADETILPTYKKYIEKKDGYILEQDGWGTTIRRKEDGYFHEVVDTIIKTPDDLDKLEFDSAALDCRYDSFIDEINKDKDDFCIFCKIGGPFIRSSFIRGEINWLMDIGGDIGFAKELAGRVGEHLLQIGLQSLKRGNLYDTGISIDDDMASNSGLMFSPSVFEEIFLPIYKKLVSSFKAAGASKVMFHSDGNIMSILDMLIEAGVDSINPIEYKAGMDLVKIREKYGDKLALIGGVDNAFILPRGNKDEIKAHIMPILEAGKNGGVIAAAHSIGPDVSIEAYEYYNSLVKNFKI